MIDAHERAVTHHYTLSYPEHSPRADDPHYKAFEAWKRKHVPDTGDLSRCYVAEHYGNTDSCGGRIEVHHKVIEFAFINEIDLQALEEDYPGLTDEQRVDQFAESGQNFMLLCSKHHRGSSEGIHSVVYADWETALYTPGLLEGHR